jgi:phospholipid/cholesterol/gamma-HCH transport system substrate-binding protein
VKLDISGDKIANVSGDLSVLTEKINKGEGTIGMLVLDTAFAKDLRSSVKNLDQGTAGFNENMEALKHSFLLRKYFRKQARENVKK